MKKLLVLAAVLTTGSIAYGQEEPKIKVSGYLEVMESLPLLHFI